MKKKAVGALLFLVLVCLPISAFPATGAFSASNVAPGSTVTLYGTARPGSAMSVYFSCNSGCGQIHVGVAQVDNNGRYSLAFKVPLSAKPGGAYVQAGCDKCGNGWTTFRGLNVKTQSRVNYIEHEEKRNYSVGVLPNQPVQTDRLTANQVLQLNRPLVSQNGKFKFVLQGDGNLVLYGQDGKSRWSSNTAGRAVSELVLQGDGNFVMYGPGGAIWNTRTNGNSGAWLVVQDDGNVVIYNSQNKPLWSIYTAAVSRQPQTASSPVNLISGLVPMCMDVAYASHNNGTGIGLWPCHSGDNQQFTFMPNGEIRVYGNKCVDASGGKGNNGDKIIIWDCNNGPNQKWHVTQSGEIRGMNKRCLDRANNWLLPGGALVLWDCNNGKNQKWAAVTFQRPQTAQVNFSDAQKQQILTGISNLYIVGSGHFLGSGDSLVGNAGSGFTMPIGNNLANVTPLTSADPLTSSAP